jgi:hypothetical protein
MAQRPARSGTDSSGFWTGIGDGLSVVYKALQLVRGIKILLPLLLYFVFELFIIVLYARSGPGALDTFWALFLPGRDSGALGHYPQRLLLLPVLIGRVDILFDILLHVVAQGITVLLVASALEGSSLRLARSFGHTMGRYWHLAGVMLVATVVILAATYLPALPMLLDWTAYNRHIATGGGIIIGILVQVFFLYAVPFVLIDGESFLASIGRSIRFARRRYLLSLTLASVSFAVTLPTFLLGFKAQIISLRIFPELIMHIEILGEIMKLISTYILVGGVTVIFMEDASARPDPGRRGTQKEEEGGR